jgi:hypothetical protein
MAHDKHLFFFFYGKKSHFFLRARGFKYYAAPGAATSTSRPFSIGITAASSVSCAKVNLTGSRNERDIFAVCAIEANDAPAATTLTAHGSFSVRLAILAVLAVLDAKGSSHHEMKKKKTTDNDQLHFLRTMTKI